MMLLFLKKNLVTFMMILTLFFSFTSFEWFWCLSWAFFRIVFLLQKDSDILHMLLFEAFLCVFDIYLPFLYIYKKKIIKTCFYWFLYSHSVLNFLHQNFFHQDFLHWKFLHKNLLFQNQKKFLCHQWYTQASLFL